MNFFIFLSRTSDLWNLSEKPKHLNSPNNKETFVSFNRGSSAYYSREPNGDI